MQALNRLCQQIKPRDHKIEEEIKTAWGAEKTSYGKLVDMVAQYGSCLGAVNPPVPKPCMVIASADHGIVKMGVSAYPQSTTIGMTTNYLIPKGAGANALANYCGASMVVVDMGINADMSQVPGLRHCKIRKGTRNFLREPAMTEEEAEKAIMVGVTIAQEEVKKGHTVFLVGEMGIANTTAAAVMTALFSGLSAKEATGRGSNISDERLKVKTQVVAQALEKYKDIGSEDGFHILQCVGGYEFACLVGVILGAAAQGAMTIIDGFNTTACALVAHTMAPACMDHVMASHLSAEKAHIDALKTLGLTAYVDLKLCLGEASGGAIQAGMLEMAVRIYQALQKKEG
ncbi:MAG: nicotinate-nucleotide--dimethylbenzimidazole phosphoribosyltransferase [Veillonellaceae bacterium]|nr:nicotinate-nucleotide--dimethylbenzimidazole phosphoribosyltransferase [Veillonellaceae bacterium]